MNALLDHLNPEQRKAAESIFGSHLVLAGAGTGKTEVLAKRIANMLQSDAMITPNMILCLTFTEAGVVAMRRRLVDTIGPEAYNIPIHTFHSFCNEIIQNNPDFFGIRNFEPVTELEQLEVIYQIIDEISASNPLKRLRGDVYYESARLKNLFLYMKEENITVEQISEVVKLKRVEIADIVRVSDLNKKAVEEGNYTDEFKKDCIAYIDSLGENGKYLYKRPNSKKGIYAGYVKPNEVDKALTKLTILQEASRLLYKYNDLLKEKQRYDFSDMIHWVLDAFKEDEYFLLSHQDRYQFVLVDEFQDTNGSQLELVNTLMSFWENPDIFVVADDDQTLYEFNGARIQNVLDFQKQYGADTTILINNYRSSQGILDGASKVIANNQGRLINEMPGLNKDLIASNPSSGNNLPQITEHQTPLNEVAFVINEIKQAIQRGEDISNTAIIYRKHKQADTLIQQLEAENIKYNIRRGIDVLDTVAVNQILCILEYIVATNNLSSSNHEALLFEILHYNFWNNDIMKIHEYYTKQADRGTKTRRPQEIMKTTAILTNLSKKYYNTPIMLLLNEILDATGMLKYILQQDNYLQTMQFINSFWNWVKDEGYKRPEIKGITILKMVEKMRKNRIRIPVIDLHTYNSGVNLTTVHGAKGLEWDKVFMIGCNRNEWEGARTPATSYSIPTEITHAQGEDKVESNRRLFYVGMTRAKKNLSISFNTKSEGGKDIERSQFIDETELPIQQAKELDMTSFLSNAIVKNDYKLEINDAIVKQRLIGFTLSVSSMNSYLRCPVAFYYEKVLRVPFIVHPALVMGNAIHLGLKLAYDYHKKNKKDLALKAIVKTAVDYIGKYRSQLTQTAFENGIAYATRVLEYFYTNHYPQSNKITSNEYQVRRVTINGVPFTGDIDKMEFVGNNIDIVDYKSGNPQSAKAKMNRPKDEGDMGGDYWRQLTSYKLMVDNSPANHWHFNSARLEILTDKEVVQLTTDISVQDEVFVEKQIKYVWDSIMNLEFDKGCEEPDCNWCNLKYRR